MVLIKVTGSKTPIGSWFYTQVRLGKHILPWHLVNSKKEKRPPDPEIPPPIGTTSLKTCKRDCLQHLEHGMHCIKLTKSYLSRMITGTLRWRCR